MVAHLEETLTVALTTNRSMARILSRPSMFSIPCAVMIELEPIPDLSEKGRTLTQLAIENHCKGTEYAFCRIIIQGASHQGINQRPSLFIHCGQIVAYRMDDHPYYLKSGRKEAYKEESDGIIYHKARGSALGRGTGCCVDHKSIHGLGPAQAFHIFHSLFGDDCIDTGVL